MLWYFVEYGECWRLAEGFGPAKSVKAIANPNANPSATKTRLRKCRTIY